MANPTTNYSFAMPTNTDLVKDLPADFDIFGQAVDDRIKALNPETTLGDIAYRSATANTNTRLAIGTTGQVLTVAAGVPAWQTIAGPSFQTYTPTLANLTLGNGTLTAKYAQTGKIVTVYFNFTLGSTSSVGSNPSMTLPVSAADIYNTAKLFLGDYGTVTYWGSAWNGDATTVYLEADRADATYLKAAGVTATVPHTWAVNDSIVFTLTYLAA
jgi:hypothetical protein